MRPIRRLTPIALLAAVLTYACTGAPPVATGAGPTGADPRLPTPAPTHTGLSPAPPPIPTPRIS